MNILSKDNFGTITNPLDSEDGNWVEAHEVTDFENIHSFIIVLNEGDVIEVDEKFSIEFTTVVDQGDKVTLSKIKEQKVAWNSFAYSVNGKPTVEPLQVGVVITPFVDTPEIPREPNKPVGPYLPQTGSPGIIPLATISFALGLVLYIISKKKKNIHNN